MRDSAKKFWYYISSKKLTVPSAALILGATYFISNILGVYRERLIAAKFGASHVTDIFYASFKLPDLIFNLLVLGAISSAFIPVFVDHINGDDRKDEANKVASNFMNFLFLGTIILCIIIFVLARKLVPFLLPGFFSGDNLTDLNTFEVAVKSTRLMLLSPIFFSLSSVFGGVLNAKKRFISYSLAPVIYNVSIIFGIIFLSTKTNPPIYGLLFGVILGSVLHAAIQLPAVIKTGFRYYPLLDLRSYDLPRIFKLMIPRTIAIGVGQINLLVDTIIASYFVGGITVLNFANDIQTLPTVVFGIAIATAVFPLLAEQSSRSDQPKFIKTFSEAARKILYFMIPATIGLIVLRAQIVRLIFGIGHFSWDNTYWTTKALGFFAIGLLAQGLTPLCVRAFYAIKDTKTPLIAGLATMITNVVLSVTLPFIPGFGLGIAGIALAFSVSGYVNIIILLYLLNNRVGALDGNNKVFASTSRLILASVIMGLLTHYSLYLFDIFVDTHTVIGLGTQTLGAVTIGAVSYYLLTHLFGCEEAGTIFKRAIL